MEPLDPLRLDGNISENWKKWKQRWLLYSKASGAGEKEESVQCAIFLHMIGEPALDVYESFEF